MQKWNTDLLELNAKLWEAAMNTTDNFSAEIRPKDAVDRQQEKTVSSFNACMGSSTQRVQQTLQYLENRQRRVYHSVQQALSSGYVSGYFSGNAE